MRAVAQSYNPWMSASSARPAPAQPSRAERPARKAASEPSGRLLLRMPRSLHGALAQIAERDGTSLNQLITGTLASAIGWNGESIGDAGPRKPASGPLSGPATSRTLLVLLVVNGLAVGLAALAAIGLLVYAWQG